MKLIINTAFAVVRDSTIDKILLVKALGKESWELPGGIVPSGQLPLESITRYIYKQNTTAQSSGFRLVAVLGWENFGGFDFVYNKTVGNAGDSISPPDRLETRFFSLSEIFLEKLVVSNNHQKMIGAWQKQLHANTVLETHFASIEGVTVGTEMIRIKEAP